MNDHDHPQNGQTAPPETPVDAGSQALAEALRSSFAIVKFVMVLLVLVFLGSGFFTVGPQERAIVLRFGEPLGEGEKALLAPGKLHWSFPYPIDEVVKVPLTGIPNGTAGAGNRPPVWQTTRRRRESVAGPGQVALVVPLPDRRGCQSAHHGNSKGQFNGGLVCHDPRTGAGRG